MRGQAGLLIAAMLTSGCAGEPTGNIEKGREDYARYCVQCHEAAEGIGSRLTVAGLASYGTAAGLLEYNRRYMPYNAEGTLTDQHYLDITAYMLVEHGFADPDLQLTAANGHGIPLRR